MDKLVLIDGNSLLNRSFYATPVFSTSSGQPTNAIFGFVKLVFKILNDLNPKYMIVAFDLKAPTFRHKMYDAYKATRRPMPEELASQVEPLKALLSAMKIATCELEGYEADDLIGTLSRKFDVHSYIYTGDRDSFQLVDEKTDVYYTKRGVTDLLKLSADNFVGEVGLVPAAIIDLKALMGDKSDNIPGVAGNGEITARKLLAEYGTLEGVYNNIDGIKSASTRNKLSENEKSAKLSYALATIDCNCPIEIKLENCFAPKSYSDEVREMFSTFEFRSLLNDASIEWESGEKYNVVKSEYPDTIEIESLCELEELCSKSGEFYIAENGDRFAIYFNGTQYTLTVGEENLLSPITPNAFFRNLYGIFANENNHVVVYDLKRILHALANVGLRGIKCSVDDVSVMKYLTDYSTEAKNLNELCSAKGFKEEFSAFALSKIYLEYDEILHHDEIVDLYNSIEKPLIIVLFEMEDAGVKVDLSQLEALGEIYLRKINDLKSQIYAVCGKEFNINSPTQLGEVLFNTLGLKSGKKNKSGKYSTNAEVLESLAAESEPVRLILSYRQYQKLYSTYIEGFRPLINKKTHFVKTTYNQTVTATGRLSSANPNLQNIPVREEEGRELRKVFIPRDGNVFIDADYSQIELRLLAHFSQCKELIAAYEADEDVHSVTASQVFGVPLSEVTPKMRREAKAVNFGIIYGISEFGLAKNIGISVKTAREYIEKYFEHYTDVKKYMDSNVEFAKSHGFVATLTGRKRYINEINSSNYNLRQFGERAAMNMPLQGSSADIIKIAMVNLSGALQREGLKTKLILQVHDELVLDAPIAEKARAAEILQYEMENAVKLSVPLKVSVSIGNNWYEAK